MSEKPRRPWGLPNEPRDQSFDEHPHLAVEGRGERQPKRVVPPQTSQPGEDTHDRTRDRQGVRTRSAKRADEPTQSNVEDSLRERVDSATGEASIDAWAVAEKVDGPKREAHGNPGRPPGAFERPKVANEEPEQRRVRIAIGGQPSHTLEGPRPLSQPLEVLAQADEWRHDVEVVHPDELAPPGVEEDQLAQGEQLEGASESRAHPTGCLGHAPQLAELQRVEVDEPIALAELAAPDHDRPCLVDGHGGRRYEVRRKPNSLSALSSRRQFRRTCTVRSR